MPNTVQWPSAIATHVEAWRLLDLSGLTDSVRESRDYTRAGYLYVNSNKVTSQGYRVEIGSSVLLELRFPNGQTRSLTVMPVNRTTGRQRPRQTGPRVLNRRG